MGGNYYNPRAFGAGLGASSSSVSTTTEPELASAKDVAYAQAARRDPLVGVLLPKAALDRVETVTQAVMQLSIMENEAVETANAFIRQHNAGQVAVSDYPKYDAYRHRVNDAQVAYHRGLRAILYSTVGVTLGQQLMARVPWPTWLPAVRPETPRNVPAVTTGEGTSGLGVAQFVLIGAAILTVLALVVAALYFTSDIIDALERAYLARAQAQAIDRILADRRQVYDQCIAQGGTPAQCAAVVNQAFSSEDVNRFFQNTRVGKGPLWYLGLAVVLAGAGVAGWWTYKTFYKPKPSMRGLGRATRLRGLNDSTPSRYMLEVDA